MDVLAIERNADLALLRADAKSDGLQFADMANVQKGMKVFAIGYPQTSIQGNESKITDGIISSMSGLQNDSGWYQISVPIQSGNSGGPLVSEDGRLVGVVVATVNAAKFLSLTGSIPQNINFGIKGDVVMGFLQRNGVKPMIARAKSRFSLAKVDENTLFIASKPVPFNDVPAQRSPSEQNVTNAPTYKEQEKVLPLSKVLPIQPEQIEKPKTTPKSPPAIDGNTKSLADMYLLGRLTIFGGNGIQKDEAAGTKLILEAADKGFPTAQQEIGNFYLHGRFSFPRDPVKANTYFRNSALQGNAQAQFELGLAYEDGTGGCEKSMKDAAFWYQKAGDQGHSTAKSRLSVLPK